MIWLGRAVPECHTRGNVSCGGDHTTCASHFGWMVSRGVQPGVISAFKQEFLLRDSFGEEDEGDDDDGFEPAYK